MNSHSNSKCIIGNSNEIDELPLFSLDDICNEELYHNDFFKIIDNYLIYCIQKENIIGRVIFYIVQMKFDQLSLSI